VTTSTSETLQIQAQVTALGSITNTATVTHSDQPDSNSANNTGSVALTSRENSVDAGEAVTSAQPLESQNGQYSVVVQSDGNVVIYGPGGATWSTGTFGSAGSYFVLQSDGNVVLYGPAGTVDWSAHTAGLGGTELVVQNDGNLVLYGPHGAVWSALYGYAGTFFQGQSLVTGESLTSPNGMCQAVLQSDGNFVGYCSGHVFWSTGTFGSHAVVFAFQSDANLVLYGPPGHADWASSTRGSGGTRLAMQNDGNLVLYGSGGGAIWSALYG
jgi:hypothetical protein